MHVEGWTVVEDEATSSSHRRIITSSSLSPQSGGGRTLRLVPVVLWVRARVRAMHRCHPRCEEVGMTGNGNSARMAFVFTWRGSVEGRGEGNWALFSSTVV